MSRLGPGCGVSIQTLRVAFLASPAGRNATPYLSFRHRSKRHSPCNFLQSWRATKFLRTMLVNAGYVSLRGDCVRRRGRKAYDLQNDAGTPDIHAREHFSELRATPNRRSLLAARLGTAVAVSLRAFLRV